MQFDWGEKKSSYSCLLNLTVDWYLKSGGTDGSGWGRNGVWGSLSSKSHRF